MHPLLKTTLATVLAAAVLAPAGAPAYAATSEKEWVSPPTSFQFSGAGWGHGVGMSQYGSRGMAQAGKSAEQILEHYYSPADLTKEARYASDDIRVQVLHSATATMSVTGGQVRVKDGNLTRMGSSSLSYKVAGGKLSYTIDGKTYTAARAVTVQWEGTRAWASSKKAIVSVQRANDGFGSVAYRHGVMNIGVLANKVNIVNQLRLNDEYLYGLAEVPSSWEPASLQTQAIAGRTYAMKNMSSVKSACDCNVYDEVASQKFTAWNKENENNGTIGARWKSAVDATLTRSSGTISQAQVMKNQGALIDAVYSSSTGGKTRAAKSVWGYDHAYLQSREDNWALKASVGNPNASWTRTISQAQARTGFGLNDVVDIAIAKSADLSVSSATATSKNGEQATLTGSRFRSLIGAKAAWVLSGKSIGGEQGEKTPLALEKTSKGVKYQTTANLNLRDAPVSGKIIKTLAIKSNVVTTGNAANSQSWLEVTVDGRTGWVSKGFLSVVKSAPAPKPTPPKPAPKPVPSKPAPAKTITKTTHTTTSNLNLRSTAVKGKIVATMKKGTVITLTGKTAAKGSWVQVKVGGKTGWASKRYIKTTKTTVKANSSTNKAIIKTVTANLNLRAGAGTKHKVVTTLKKGAKVTLQGAAKSGWVKVSSGPKTGFVSTGYLK